MLLRRIRQALLERAIGMLDERRRRLLAWRSMQASGVRSMSFERDGMVWHVPEFDDIAYFLFVDGGFQCAERRALIEWMRRHGVLSESRDVVADVGAHIGSTCIPLVWEAGCRALAIEPLGRNVRLLKLNVESSGLGERIRVVKKAVLRGPETITMCQTRGNSGDSFVRRHQAPGASPVDAAGSEEVDGDGIAAIIRSAGLRLDEIALVWADMQGCESELIESGAPLWEAGVPCWAEIEPYSLVRQGFSCGSVRGPALFRSARWRQ